MPRFRYAQQCPLARGAEIVGQRWTLLIVRELLLGPKRFSDLRHPLAGVSTSVLSERLAQLEAQGIVSQRRLGPPAPAVVYELTESGRALLPVLIELARWGARFLGEEHPDDHFDPDWLRLGIVAYGRRSACPSASFALHWPGGEGEISISIAGGRKGLVVRRGLGGEDAAIHARHPATVMALASGMLDPREAIRSGEIRVEGRAESLDLLPQLFDMGSDTGAEAGVLGNHDESHRA